MDSGYLGFPPAELYLHFICVGLKGFSFVAQSPSLQNNHGTTYIVY